MAIIHYFISLSLCIATCVAAAQFNHINDDAIIEVNAESGYFNDAKIHWEIHSKHGHEISLILRGMIIEECKECSCDYLQIDQAGESGEKMCGTRFNTTVYKKRSGNVSVMFVSDYSVNLAGFRLEVVYVPEDYRTKCDGQLLDFDAETSKAYNVVMHADKMKEGEFCGLVLKSYPNMKLKVTAVLLQDTECSKEMLFFNGDSYCGETGIESYENGGTYIYEAKRELIDTTVVFSVKYTTRA